MPRTRKPAEGERAAIGGYYPQYLLSSDLVLRRLDEGRLEWVRLADPEAGRVDDFQIGTPDRVDAYQFKWSGQPTTFNFSDLTQETKKQGSDSIQPCLIAQLADGWQRLRKIHPGRRVVVHLMTNDIPGPNKTQIPVADPPPGQVTFASFLSEAWTAAKSGSVPPGWQPAIDALRAKTGLNPSEFNEFVQDCELELGRQLPEQSSDTREATLRWTNLQLLVAFFEETIQKGTVVEMRSDQLLRSIGWEGRYRIRSRHEFPEPNIPYRAISATVAQVERRLAELAGGYVAVVGPPGSGKSVLLTQTLRRPRTERVIRYYAYVPDAQDPRTSRGESVNFLHDICLTLQHAGISVEGTHLPSERDLLLDRFHRQLALLGEEYRRTGRKTFILIDGLDHIERELRPTRSLLADLPQPDQIPDGVFIVLGTQTDQLADLSERIRHALDQDGRRISMDRLDRSSVRSILQNAGLKVALSSDQLDRVYHVSDGHPLALGYLVQALRGATDDQGIEKLLASTEHYKGDIDAQYRTYWQSVRSDATLVRLLAALARLRGGIDLTLLADWYGHESVQRVVSTFGRYFVVDPDGRWRFFHNSFRVFLRRETQRGYSGELQRELDLEIHRELADRFASRPIDAPDRWEELYHRVAAGDHEGVCRIATQRYFRGQAFGLRPLDAVKTDIEIALPSAASQEDIRAYAALALSRVEIEKREQLLQDVDLPQLLLDAGEVRLAVDAARDGNRLRMGVISALELAVQLDAAGQSAEARRIFELAEPLDLLSGQGGKRITHDAWRIVEAWAAAAPQFRPLDEVLDVLASTPLRELAFRNADDHADQLLRVRLHTTVGVTLIGDSRWDDLERVLARIPSDELGRNGRFWLLLQAARANDDEQRAHFVQRLRQEFPAAELGARERLELAELLHHTKDEASARELISNLPLQVPPLDEPGHDDEPLFFVAPLLRHARLLYELGDTRDSSQMVPDGMVTNRGDRIWFLRDIVVVAEIWALARLGRLLSSWDIRQRIRGIMQRFNRSFEKGEEYLGWLACRKARGKFYELLVRAVKEHGAEPLSALREEFERQWQGDNLLYWPPAARREVAMAFADADHAHKEWAVRQIQNVETELPWTDLYDLVGQTAQQAQAWLALGERARARLLIAQMIRRANGIAGEDYEFDNWLAWFDHLATGEPLKAIGLLDWLARVVVSLQETAASVASSAAYRLIRTATRLDPGHGAALARWLMDQGVISYASRLKAFLEGALHSAEIPPKLAIYVLGELVMPFDPRGDEEVCRSAVLTVHRVAGIDLATWAVEYFASRIATCAVPTAREEWNQGLKDAAGTLGIRTPACVSSPSPPQTSETGGSSRLSERQPPDQLVLEDDRKLSLPEVLRHEHNIAALTELAHHEKYDSAFDWSVVVERLCHTHGPDDVGPLLRALKHARPIREHLLAKSRTCRAANDERGAWRYGTLALDAIDGYGWSRRYGDGSTLDVTQNLIEVRPTEARKKLWHLVTTSGGKDPTVLEEVLCQLRGERPVREIWPEIEDYVHALFDEHLPKTCPTGPDLTASSSGIDAALVRIVLDDIEHPAQVVARAARRVCALGLCNGEGALIEAVRAILIDQDSRCRTVLDAIDAAGMRESASAMNFGREIEFLADSSDAMIAAKAADLCQRYLGLDVPSVAPRPLPDAYRIALPDDAMRALTPRAVPDPGQPWSDTNDPRELLAIFDLVYRLVAEATRIRELTLQRRGVQLMHELADPTSWSQDAERRLHWRLDQAGLRFTYRRPAAEVAFRATRRVIGELWHAGRLSPEAVQILLDHINPCDPALLLAEPAIRPFEIAGIPEEKMLYDAEKSEWVDSVQMALSSLPDRLADGRVILAELSNLEAIGHGLRSEQRMSVLCPEEEADLSQDDLIPKFVDLVVAKYTSATPAEGRAPLVIRASAVHTSDNPAGDWVAFNPALAQRFGWILSSEGLFRWSDALGRIMVESVWWLDGPIGQRGMSIENCVGEGWLVLATPEAMAIITAQQPALHRVLLVNRKTTFESGSEKSLSTRKLWPLRA